MSEEQDAAPPIQNDTAIVPAPVATPAAVPDAPDAFGQMADLVQKASQALLSMDAQTARQCAYLARGTFEDARAIYGKDDLAALDFLCSLTCFYDPLVSALIMQVEGRYTEALSRIDEALQTSDKLQQGCVELAKLDDWKPLVASTEPGLRPFPALLRGSRNSIEAELFGYQGNIEQYLYFLGNAVAEFRTVKTLRPSANPTFLQLVQMCNQQADRLESRSRNFEPMLHDIRYMTASGDKILIIHGQNEGKWRELKDLLKERGREVVVVEEMPDEGAVLIDKCIKYAAECCYAIALFTPDDMVKAGKNSIFQARPNVLFELGWFYGRFGPGRVLILCQQGVVVPSDLGGVLTKNFQTKVKEVITDIEKELPPAKPQMAAAPQ